MSQIKWSRNLEGGYRDRTQITWFRRANVG